MRKIHRWEYPFFAFVGTMALIWVGVLIYQPRMWLFCVPIIAFAGFTLWFMVSEKDVPG